FRKDEEGNFIWPGFGENSRVLEWVFNRCNDEGETVDTALGNLPAMDGLNVDGLDLSDSALEQLLTVDEDALRQQLPQVEEHLAKFGDDLPDEIRNQFETLKSRLGA
ncbi:MAG: phosphoenolpyruvate carboxykinase (GTP), partial [Actinomycetota bacterium]|nr:phosphoenolpyruvate carboxykinase (GTP) [Actinomycetota bacterium]